MSMTVKKFRYKSPLFKGIDFFGLTAEEKVGIVCRILNKMAAIKAAVPVVFDGSDAIGTSKASLAIGADNIATMSVVAPIMPFSVERLEPELKKMYREAVKAMIYRLRFNGVVTENGELYKISHLSASGRKTGHAIMVVSDMEAQPMYLMSYREHQFYGLSIEDWWKTKSNIWSSQIRYDDEMKDLVPLRMRDFIVCEAPKHEFHVRRVRQFDADGKEQPPKWEVVDTRTGDANGIVFRGALRRIWVNEMHRDIRELKTHRCEQTRGKSVKETNIDVDEEIWFPEMGITHINSITHGVVPVDEIPERHIVGIFFRDCMKSKVWERDWETFIDLDDDVLWTCASSSDDLDELTETVKLSRQMFAPIYGMNRAEVEDLCADTIQHVKAAEKIEEVEFLSTIFDGFENTVIGKKMMEDAYRSARHEAEFARLTVAGCFAFCIWELRPLFAFLSCDANGVKNMNYRDWMTLHGLEVYFGAKKKHGWTMFGRYPSLKRNFIYAKIRADKDADMYCPNICVMGWDIPANHIIKADTDGDTPEFFFPANEAEKNYVMQNYDWDAMYIPDEFDDVTIEEFIATQKVEHTVSIKRMREICLANGVEWTDELNRALMPKH